ncbi:MAG: hypothetical protein M3016_04785 [Actinomycetota bacterium]|nr:hypothetical protein [Actinomycetota bacterium]
MSTAAIIVIVVVVVLVLVALLVLMPRMRERNRLRRRESELDDRREHVVEANRAEAGARDERADEAERRARIAQQEAQRERAEANIRQEKADIHERGIADEQLIDPEERKDFAGTSAVPEERTERTDTQDDSHPRP